MSEDAETLQYPAKIAPILGMHKNEVNALRKKGCRFYGRKTSLAWVREYLRQVTEPPNQGTSERQTRPEHLQAATAGKVYE